VLLNYFEENIMKAILAKLLEYLHKIFSDADGNPSSKRWLAFYGIVIATILAFMKYDTEYVLIFIALTGSNSVVSVFEKKNGVASTPENTLEAPQMTEK